MGATLQVFCAGAVKPAILEFVPPFERATGRALQFTFGPVGSLQARVLAGDGDRPGRVAEGAGAAPPVVLPFDAWAEATDAAMLNAMARDAS